MMTEHTVLKTGRGLVDAVLETILPPAEEHPAALHRAMRYSVFGGGKRIRPALCIASCEACGGTKEQAMAAACAVELLHTYTLIHDDLPAMDDDTLRRGRPCCHIAFDEATAILAGDALLTLAFETLAECPNRPGELAAELARAAGSRGVVGGQAEDLAAENRTPNAKTVEVIHRNKTAALIRASCVLGGICANADTGMLERLSSYGEDIGLAFQLIDDLLDERAAVEKLGKNTGSDRARGKMTWLSAHGAEQTESDARRYHDAAIAALNGLPAPGPLIKLADLIVRRSF